MATSLNISISSKSSNDQWLKHKHLALSKLQSINNFAVSALGRFWNSEMTHAGAFSPTRFFLHVQKRRTCAFAASNNFSWQGVKVHCLTC